MTPAHWALLMSGGLILAGIAYPAFARQQAGWKTGTWSGGAAWSLWYGMGALAYLAGMGTTFGILGLMASIPLALILGFTVMMIVKRQTQLVALTGPVLANLWFM